ncbi:hypothetical protein [uncultured Mycobacterium sp.]|uniref:hypothetical protein n=1 Tax=uncultured Mycobacterium sp. TaxID=171292 RepID=UPI0035CC7010
MTFRGAHKPSWKRSASALVVAVCVLVAAIGYVLARADRAVAAAPQALTSAGAANADDERPGDHIEQADSPIPHSVFHIAALHRTRPSTWSPSAQLSCYSPQLASSSAVCVRLGVGGSCTPVTPLAGRERLTQLCVARR